jgi:hypothetical protein
MSDAENFVARWSRRKRHAAKASDDDPHARAGFKPTPADMPAAEPASGEAASGVAVRVDPGSQESARNQSEQSFDVARLPPIESITALTDIRAFLAPGVPPELARAALRRAWTADPKIRDFVGLADYDWDFNDPGAMAGFGPLEMTDELRRQLTEMVGRAIAPEQRREAVPAAVAAPGEIEKAVEPLAAPPAQAGVGSEKSSRGNSVASRQSEGADVAVQNNEPTKPKHDQSVAKRTHGGALPE